MMDKREGKGIVFAATGYLLWGILPLYWRGLKGIPALELLNYRIILSFLSLGIFLLVMGKFREYLKVLGDRETMKRIIFSALALCGNWGAYTYTMISDRIVEASLAYYISPLLMALTGVLVFKEEVSRLQKYGIALAGTGVTVLAFGSGVVPFWGIFIAISFAAYGAIKKNLGLDPFIGLALEMTIALPFALIFTLGRGTSTVAGSQLVYLLLLGGGTVIPLLFFVKGAQLAKFSEVAILQYIYPSIALIIGVFIYGESFTSVHLLSFGIIWIAVAIFLIPFFMKRERVEERS